MTEERIDQSIAEMEVRQAKQARAIHARAIHRIIEDRFRSSKDASDVDFRTASRGWLIQSER